jgi:glutamyl-tRNA reductase
VALGADLAAEALGTLQGREVVVVGAGQMAGLAVKHLRRRGVGSVRILNRSVEHARSLAERTDARHGDLDALPEALAGTDLVVSATGASGVVIRPEAVGVRDRHPLVLVDLAVPRDVDPAVGALTDVTLIDIGSLRSHLSQHDEQTSAEIARAHEIIAEEVRRFVIRGRSDALAPIITALRARGDEILRAELARYASRLDELTPDERVAVEQLARGIVAKLLHDPIVALKERSEPGSDGAHARLLADLLGIEPAGPR